MSHAQPRLIADLIAAYGEVITDTDLLGDIINVYLVLRGIRPGMLFDLGLLPEFQFKFIETILARGNGRVAALHDGRSRGIYIVNRPGAQEAAKRISEEERIPCNEVSREISTLLGYTYPSGLGALGIDLSMGLRATPLTHSVHMYVNFEGGERTNIMTSLCLTREGAEIEYDSFNTLAVVITEAIAGLTFDEWTVQNVTVGVREII